MTRTVTTPEPQPCDHALATSPTPDTQHRSRAGRRSRQMDSRAPGRVASFGQDGRSADRPVQARRLDLPSRGANVSAKPPEQQPTAERNVADTPKRRCGRCRKFDDGDPALHPISTTGWFACTSDEMGVDQRSHSSSSVREKNRERLFVRKPQLAWQRSRDPDVPGRHLRVPAWRGVNLDVVNTCDHTIADRCQTRIVAHHRTCVRGFGQVSIDASGATMRL